MKKGGREYRNLKTVKRTAEAFIEKAADIVSRYQEYGRKAGVGEEWIKIIEKEIAARVESLNDRWIK